MGSAKSKFNGGRDRPRQAHWLRRLKYFAINAFIVFHLVAITVWAVPFTGSFVAEFREFVRPYFVWAGLFQSWDMFSPGPKSANGYVEAVIIYKDGTSDLWSFPRMELMGVNERYVKERYRKYDETLPAVVNADLWPDAARYVARLNSSPARPAAKVMLVFRWSYIIPRTDGRYDRGPWNVSVFYTYDVKPEDLK